MLEVAAVALGLLGGFRAGAAAERGASPLEEPRLELCSQNDCWRRRIHAAVRSAVGKERATEAATPERSRSIEATVPVMLIGASRVGKTFLCTRLQGASAPLPETSEKAVGKSTGAPGAPARSRATGESSGCPGTSNGGPRSGGPGESSLASTAETCDWSTDGLRDPTRLPIWRSAERSLRLSPGQVVSHRVRFELLDTPGCRELSPLLRPLYRRVGVVLAVFNPSDRKSWEELRDFWFAQQQTLGAAGARIVCVVCQVLSARIARRVPRHEAAQWCEEHALPYFEIDARAPADEERLLSYLARGCLGVGDGGLLRKQWAQARQNAQRGGRSSHIAATTRRTVVV